MLPGRQAAEELVAFAIGHEDGDPLAAHDPKGGGLDTGEQAAQIQGRADLAGNLDEGDQTVHSLAQRSLVHDFGTDWRQAPNVSPNASSRNPAPRLASAGTEVPRRGLVGHADEGGHVSPAMSDTAQIDRLAASARAVVGSAAVRPGADGDAVDGVVPELVVEPPDGRVLAETLAWAAAEGRRVLIQGGGTKVDWGPRPSRLDVLLSTRRLDAVLDHRHGDLTATVEAGATLAAVNEALARHEQWIPLDPPGADRATIGGIIATNDSGPRRHRHGSPRDLIIGVELALVDGRRVKAGGIVVKNVAGYDLARLLTGSFGSLAAILSASFKLAPRPPASRTVLVATDSIDDLGAIALALTAGQLTPTAIESQLPERRLLVRFETVAAATADQADRAVALAGEHRGRATVLDGESEQALWRAHGARPWAGPGLVLKVTALPADLAATLGWIERAAGERRLGWEAVGRAGLGVQLIRLEGAVEPQAGLITDLRTRLVSGRGSAVLLRGSPELKAQVDAWGSVGSAAETMRAVKRQFDPMGVLNPGRGPVGI